jgi:hypothetical protein
VRYVVKKTLGKKTGGFAYNFNYLAKGIRIDLTLILTISLQFSKSEEKLLRPQPAARKDCQSLRCKEKDRCSSGQDEPRWHCRFALGRAAAQR